MFRFTYCFLTIFVLLSIIMGTIGRRPRKNPVPKDINEQCRALGPDVVGACQEQSIANGEIICSKLVCAYHDLWDRYVVLEAPGRVKDGTICAHRKACRSGVCVSSPKAVMAPPQYLPGLFTCIQEDRPRQC